MTDAEKAEAGMKEVEKFLNLTWLYTPDMAQDTAKGLHEALAEVARLEAAGADEQAIKEALTRRIPRVRKATAGSAEVQGWLLLTMRSMVRTWLAQGEHQERLQGYLDEIDIQVNRFARLRPAGVARH